MEDIGNLYLETEDKKIIQNEKYNFKFNTKFKFLAGQYGLRAGCIHIILGASSGGKSTLVRSLVSDIYENNSSTENVMLWLSEDSLSDIKIEFADTLIRPESLQSIKCLSELDISSEGRKMGHKYVFDYIRRFHPRILIFDNITTSKFYNDMEPREQADFAFELKELAQQYNIAMVLVAHTNAIVDLNCQRLINMNDIRGTKTIVNLTQYYYILQTVKYEQQYLTTIRVLKQRGYNKEGSIYGLIYDSCLRLFIRDEPMNFEKFKYFFKKRDHL